MIFLFVSINAKRRAQVARGMIVTPTAVEQPKTPSCGGAQASNAAPP
jgi:hypothetical protein